jgi:hypothetical protein
MTHYYRTNRKAALNDLGVTETITAAHSPQYLSQRQSNANPPAQDSLGVIAALPQYIQQNLRNRQPTITPVYSSEIYLNLLELFWTNDMLCAHAAEPVEGWGAEP